MPDRARGIGFSRRTYEAVHDLVAGDRPLFCQDDSTWAWKRLAQDENGDWDFEDATLGEILKWVQKPEFQQIAVSRAAIPQYLGNWSYSVF